MTRNGRLRILVVCGYEPNPITVRKMDALHETGEWDIHLAYWRTPRAVDRYPFDFPSVPSAVHPIPMPPPHERGNGHGPFDGLRGNLALLSFHARLRQVVREVQPHVIHASNSNMLLAAWLHCLRSPRRVLIYDLLDTDDGMRRWPFLPVQRLMHRRVDHMTVPSPRFVSEFLEPLRLMPQGGRPTQIANAPWRATFDNIAPRHGHTIVVGYVGSFRCPPAIEWLIESVRRVRARGAAVELHFAGTGVARELIERAAAEESFITYTGPYDYKADIKAIYEQLDIVYAVYEDSSDKRTHLACRLSDAIAANRAIIVARDTYMGEIVEARDLGYVVDPQDPATLDEALYDGWVRRDEWRDPRRIEPDVRTEHAFDTYVPRLRALYRDAVARRMGGTPA